MKESKSKRWFITSIILIVTLLASIIMYVIQYRKTVELTDNAVYNLEQEWYRLSKMGHYVDLYINDYDVP